MSRTRCPLCSHDLTASDIRPSGVVFRCPHCDGDLKAVSPVPRFLSMIAYLAWLIAFAAWGIVSFWALIPLAFVAGVASVWLLSQLLDAIGGVSLEPVSEQGPLPLGETRHADEERLRSDTVDTDSALSSPGWWMKPAVVEAGVALAIALFFFAMDWSGFNKWQPDLFFPKPFRDVWWHLPIIVALVFGAVHVLNRKDDAGEG